MMNSGQLCGILQREYSLQAWQHDIYPYLFAGHCELLNAPHLIESAGTTASQAVAGLIEKAVEIGHADIDGERVIFFDVKVRSRVDLRRARVSLNNLIARFLKLRGDSAAIGVFHGGKSKSYRFTFLRQIDTFDDKENLVTERTNSKRFTYILGPGKQCRTAVERFEKLHGNLFPTLDDIEDAFSVEALTKEFYTELFNWFQKASDAASGVSFPNLQDAADKTAALQEHLIRLITRLIFVWFIKQKGLVPEELFNEEEIAKNLKNFQPLSAKESNYYQGYLQNLFFATLNREISERSFAKPVSEPFRVQKNYDFGIKTLYRHQDLFQCGEPEIKKLFAGVPYLNGGLFECLDRKVEVPNTKMVWVDGFSRNKNYTAKIPNVLFFEPETGIISILKRYNFTVEENSAFDHTVALDPELLGKVFENLLGAYNPETKQTARNDSGSFYTPREIVDFMVDRSLLAYLKTKTGLDENLLYSLFRSEELPADIAETPEIRNQISDALYDVRILDPACGSGAFPVGALNRIVEIQSRLAAGQFDPYQAKMKLIENCIYGSDIQNIAVQIAKLRFFISLICEQEPDLNAPEKNFSIKPLPNLETRFVCADTLIRLGTGATIFDLNDCELQKYQEERRQISQTLIVPKNREEKRKLQKREVELAAEMRKRLTESAATPNLRRIAEWEEEIETLKKERVSVEKPKTVLIEHEQQSLFEGVETSKLSYDANQEKREQIDLRIASLTKKIKGEKEKTSSEDILRCTEKLCSWISSDLNGSADFFDPHWMFAVKDGFDILIGNPPYIQLQENNGKLAEKYGGENFKTFDRTGDIYCLFYERGHQLLREGGHLCYITSNKWMRTGYGKVLRNFLAENTNPILLVDFAGERIFESATVDTVVLLFAKGENEGKTVACAAKKGCRNDLAGFVDTEGGENEFRTKDNWSVLPPGIQTIKKKMESVGKRLKEWNVTINRGVLTGYNKAFYIDTQTKEKLTAEDPKCAKIIRPLLRGRDIVQYNGLWRGIWQIFIPWHFPLHNNNEIRGVSVEAEKAFKKQYPAVYKYLELHKKGLLARNKAEIGIRYEWYALQRWAAAYYQDFDKPKIIYPNMTKYFPFIYDTEGYLCNQKAFILTGKDESVSLLYLTALLNSLLAKLWIKSVCPELLGGTRELSKIFFENFPAVAANKRDTNTIIKLAEDRIAATKKQQEIWLKILSRYNAVVTDKLEKFDALIFGDFLKELKRQHVVIARSEKPKLEKEFNKIKAESDQLSEQIKELDAKIDQKVFKLYQLEPEEIEQAADYVCQPVGDDSDEDEEE